VECGEKVPSHRGVSGCSLGRDSLLVGLEDVDIWRLRCGLG
jgi:hypothetical protein